jgi:Asp-tRNA(Asn)/Glu-tRNA(Gln) amidotransferase A subunit family amidase
MDSHEKLDQIEAELDATYPDETLEGGLDRRSLMFLSLVASAATTFGARSARAETAAQPPAQPAPPPAMLNYGVAPAEQFQPYPAGTGALMEKLTRERGVGAFNRSDFKVEPWKGVVPTNPEDIAYLPAHRLSALLKARKITSLRLTEIYLERLKRLNPTLLCAVTIMEQQALTEARAADAEIAAGKYRGPLHGLPYGVKDLFSTKGVPTTWGCKDFENRIIDEDAEVVVRLRAAGAVLIAKLATGLFAQGDQWFRGRTKNPWNTSQGSSGSSAGPASATVSACVAFGIGTETSGSIVSPTNRCSLSGLRPTFGRVSRHGGMALAWSQDRVGPICRTIEDCAMVFNVIHGVDTKDASTVTTPFQFDRNIKLSDMRIGVDSQAPPEIVELLRGLGAKTTAIGARPVVGGAGGGLNAESAAFFDAYVQKKAKDANLDLNELIVKSRGPSTLPPGSPLASDWNPRFVTGRGQTALEFIQSQRRRMMMVAAWGEFMKDLDMFIADPMVDVGPNAQTGNPCTVVPYKFGMRPIAASPTPGAAPDPTTLKPQPFCGVIVGALYNDDKILSVAHQIQTHTDAVKHRPEI